MSEKYLALGEGRAEGSASPRDSSNCSNQTKAKAKKAGLWNFFLPDAETGDGLANLDYAYIAFELGKMPLASECLNCSAPDTGNMEVLERVGTPEQKKRWLEPLLAGEIRSAYAMTEPGLASSDARNISSSAVLDGEEWVINGEKFYISGAGDPRCKIMIVMVRSNPDAAAHVQQSQILVPVETPGVEILEPMPVFGHDDAPHGHMHIRFDNVRVPRENVLLGEGRGFEISQMRLGPGRIHHCMRAIGAAEKALQLMIERGLSRQAFGTAHHLPRQEHRMGLESTHRNRGHAPHGAQSGPGHGPHGQRRRPGMGERGEGHGARAGMPDHRPGHPDTRGRRYFPVDAAR